MSRTFSLCADPYGKGIKIFKKKTIIINPGVTVLVGCNGIGKTTMLRCIKEELEKNNIAHIDFDNLRDGGDNARSHACFHGDFDFLITSTQSSEGENIVLNISRYAKRIGSFVRSNNEKDELWILIDACDSGLSIDNIIYIKRHLFSIILSSNFSKDVYIIVSANEYEMANGDNCFDVYNGKYITFQNYDEYRDMILKSKEDKNKREKQFE